MNNLVVVDVLLPTDDDGAVVQALAAVTSRAAKTNLMAPFLTNIRQLKV